MREWSRRRTLQAVATTGALVLAGCSGEGSSPRSTPRDRGEQVPPGDLEVLFVRDTDGDPLFDVKNGSDDGPAREDGGTGARRTPSEYLWGGESRDRVTFRSTEPAAELRAFVDGTDLESRSVYLVERPVNACYEARLVGVYRGEPSPLPVAPVGRYRVLGGWRRHRGHRRSTAVPRGRIGRPRLKLAGRLRWPAYRGQRGRRGAVIRPPRWAVPQG